jgi:hypothetical protein
MADWQERGQGVPGSGRLPSLQEPPMPWWLRSGLGAQEIGPKRIVTQIVRCPRAEARQPEPALRVVDNTVMGSVSQSREE